MLVNGDFETFEESERFASRWKPHQWGETGARYYARIDKAHSHGGTKSLTLRATDAGAKPGAFTSLAVPIPYGLYEVSFWACADVDKKGKVHFSLGKHGGGDFTADEDWKQFTKSVAVRETKAVQVILRVWGSTPKVRVWIDDITVVRAKGK